MLKTKRRAVACIGDLQWPLGALEANGHSNKQEDLAATLARFPWHHFGVLVGSGFQLPTSKAQTGWLPGVRSCFSLRPIYPALSGISRVL